MKTIYLDYNATTPVDREVAAEMQQYIGEHFGNPSSSHAYGIRARHAVEQARKRLADLLNCFPDEIIFTSGGTESNNHAIRGAAFANRHKGNHIITTAVEHPAVMEVCRYLEHHGFRITRVGVDPFGMVDPEEIAASIAPETILVSVMHANNEVGTIQPIAEIARIVSAHGILLHTDAAQSVGKIPVNVREMGVDLLSVAGHKLYAPKGVGALFIRRGVQIEKLMYGADHERNLRAGTENVIEIAGLGKAAEIVLTNLELWAERQRTLRDRLLERILAGAPAARLNGHPEKRLPNTLSVAFPGTTAEALLSRMPGIAASAGAACHADQVSVSEVLTAMGVPLSHSTGTIRFSLGRYTTKEEVETASETIITAYNQLVSPESSLQSGGQSGFRLTEYTHSLGCACKIRPGSLERILKGLPLPSDDHLIVGTETSDDAAVYRITGEKAIIQTVDFIPPIVDDPYAYGAIAAANALSDVYAMGGRPLFALSTVAFPDKVLPLEVLQEILRGAGDKMAEAGIYIAGGHSIEDSEPKIGFVVTGETHPDHILRNRGALPGDSLVLTKPIGTGILTTAMKKKYASAETSAEAIRCMSHLNREAASLLPGFQVHACTDVSGFGLAGHLKEMIKGTRVDAEICFGQIPLLDGTTEYAEAGFIPGGTLNNLSHVSGLLVVYDGMTEVSRKILADAQTSGGLLIALPLKEAERFIEEASGKIATHTAIIGKIVSGSGRILVKP